MDIEMEVDLEGDVEGGRVEEQPTQKEDGLESSTCLDTTNCVGDEELMAFTRMMQPETTTYAKEVAALYFRRVYSNDLVSSNIAHHKELVRLLLDYLSLEVPQTNKLPKEVKSYTDSLLDTAWTITNIVCISKETCHSVVEQDGHKVLAVCADAAAGGSELRLQCLWAIGNIAADCPRCRENCRNYNVIQLISSILTKDEYDRPADIRNLVWGLHNLVRGGIRTLRVKVVETLVIALQKLWRRFANTPILIKDCLWIVASFADDMHTGRQIDCVVRQNGLIDDVYSQYHTLADVGVQHAALRLLGNVVTGNDRQTAAVVEHPRFYETVKHALYSPSKILQREAAWICSNAAAGNENHVETIFEDYSVFDFIMKGVEDSDAKLKKECIWTIANLLTGAGEDRSDWLIGAGTISVIPTLLAYSDVRVVERILHSLRHILNEHPHYAALVSEYDMLSGIRSEFLRVEPTVRALKENIEEILKNAEEPELPSQTYFITSK